jgi:RNA polymerase sigma factor (sigma-70 family)
MKPGDAAALVRRWLEEHGRAVQWMLARLGVPTPADRADLEQEVFITAFLALLRGESIANPRAWLNECARKKASNYRRKERLRAPSVGREVSGTMASPAQIAEDREALALAFECLDQESQEVVLAVRADGLSWDDVAKERGISVDRARYVYALAVTRMEAALSREDAKTQKHRSIAFPIFLAQVFDDIRAEVDDASPELDRRVREGLDRFMESAGAGPTEPESDRVSVARPSPIPTSVPNPLAPSIAVGPVLGIFGTGIVIGLVAGYLLRGSLSDKLVAEPDRTRSIPVLALGAPGDRTREVQVTAPLLAVRSPDEPSSPGIQRAGRASDPAPLKVTSTPGSLLLLDRARTAFGAGDGSAALALLVQHAHRFPGRSGTEDRRELVQLVCAAPGGLDSVECASLSPDSAAK